MTITCPPLALSLALAGLLSVPLAGHANEAVAQVFDPSTGVKTSPAKRMDMGGGGSGHGTPAEVTVSQHGPAPAAKGGHAAVPEADADAHAPAAKAGAKKAVVAEAHGPQAAHGDAHDEAPAGKAEAHETPLPPRTAKAARAKPRAAAGTDASAEHADPMGTLRERLAERLGAQPAPNTKSRYVMRVSNRGESGESVISAGHAPSARAQALIAGRAPGAADPHGGPQLPAAPAGAAPGGHGGAVHWDYTGEAGPAAWGELKPEFSACAVGKRQSPIDIRGGIPVELEPVKFEYRPSGFSVLDNGHTIQVNVQPGNSITVSNRRFELVQFHFHRPSEERINGRQFDMVAHLVHKDIDGKLAVIAVLLDRGSAHALVQTVWNNLPLEKGEEFAAATQIDLNRLLPEDRRYYTYMGSLTTPPCSEGVLWMVMKQPVPVSPDQVAIFAKLYPMNARPIQQASGRLIKESN